MGIKNGTYHLSSGDDGIHADKELIIDCGTIDITKSYEGLESSKITIHDGDISIVSSDDGINITKSYEGLESSKITIHDGDISIVSSDDGINVAGGKDDSSMNRPGANHFSGGSDCILEIYGGAIYVDASGDGLDSNGSIYMYGGEVIVDGPTNSGNGALDYDQEFVVQGGTLIAGGASGMAQGVSSSSSIYNLMIHFTSNYGDSDTITILDSSNQEILSYHSNKSYSSLVVASKELKNGDTYTIKVNDNDYETFTISNITTNIGSMGMMGSGENSDRNGRNPDGAPESGRVPGVRGNPKSR